MTSLEILSRQLADQLQMRGIRIVFAESCTGGLVSASLAQIPGISAWLCGSAVTYREATKSQWLSISPQQLARFTAVSARIAEQMAVRVLSITPEADVSASVTGYLGPSAPAGLDGLVFVAVCRRAADKPESVRVSRHQLSQPDRATRQQEAAGMVMQVALDYLASS